ncbi:transporter substrate-binding domain-containing protein [Aestuariispira insulae]|uniref:Amino acid ABC transporter substrate-binding protein (PAAT family) n=1 Tax=Aestuariispira insulae TaxID=1461337 RepID=A0A3D9H400_9PROT|nr:transporter substrate-binding domain-containing protein [Aestuariispira insulae]RED44202.1 amino acid ABC transporter substrate-binding protein (PAAT family) [Aestuariispira insulae]
MPRFPFPSYLTALLLALPLFLGLPSPEAFGQEAAKKLTVAIVEIEPFVVRKDGKKDQWTGLGIELWTQIARDLELEYEFRPMTASIAKRSLQDGTADLAIGDFDINSEDYRHLEFGFPYLHSSFAIASLEREESAFPRIVERLFSNTILYILGVLVLLMVFGGTIFWLMEKDNNPEMFKIDHGRLRFLNGAIWSFLLVTAQEPDVFKNSSLRGRLFATGLLIIGITVSAGYIALITSSFTVSEMTVASHGEEDLANLRIVTPANSSGIDYLNRHHLRHNIFPNIHLAADALFDGSADAIVADGIELVYFARRHAEAPLAISPIHHETEYVSLLFPKNSPLVAETNTVLINFIESAVWNRLRTQYLGQKVSSELVAMNN